ncbi:hypothetical protein FOL47_009293 [Perkinsus chesapeaki]|uniref:Gamma tubulin complex component C-terminal domain-containing protein n=1 Tax=Perkinsus chesapeaki TaxID=330153 RepID=A0A7J6MS86_PERCH|nr:hypothetical protein FOL47_009293 [Perkinsus chesapeaki]
MLGSTSVSAFGRERQNRAQSVLSALLDVLIPEELDLGYADRFARYNLAHHSFPSVDALAVNRDMKQLIVKVETRGTPVGCGELLAELYLREMPKTALAAGLKDDGDESILPSIISLLLNLSGDPCSVDRATVDRVEEELQREHAEAAARYDHLGRLREGLEEKRMLAAIAQASVETGWELAMAACDSSSDDDEDLADRTTSTASGTSSPGGLELPCFGPFALRGGAAPAVTEDTIMCAADLTRLCQSAPLGAEEAGKEPEDLLAAHVDVAEVLMLDGRRRPWLVPESWVVEEVFTACYTVAVCPPKDNTVISLNTVFHITDDVVRAHPAISKGDAVACKHLTPKALAAALDGIAVIITHVLKLATLPYIPGRYDHRSCFLSLQSEVSSLLSRLIEGLEALQHKYSTSELACTLLTLHCDLLRLATPIVKAALALRGEGPVVQQLWRCRSSGCNIAAALYRACIGPLLASARCMAYDGEVPGDSRDGHKDMVIIIEKVAADPIHPLQLVMAHTMEIPSSAQYGWEVAGHDARAQLMGQSSEAQMLLEHRLGAQAAGCHAVRELLECGSGGAAPLSSVFRALRLVCMAFDEHVQDWLADSGPRGPLWASRYGAWVKPHILTLTGVDIEIDPLGGAVRLPSMSSQQSAILTPLALQFYSEAFRLMQALYEAQSCIIAKPRCCHQGVLAFLYAVRGELLHFVRTLESYLKQSVIDPESRRFDISATKVSSVEALGRLHFHEYLHSSLARSLFMSPRTAVIRDAIMDMLTVCKSYRVLSEKAGILTLPSARLVREATFDSVSSFDASAESYPHSRGTATMEECAVEGGDPTDLISELTELRRSFKASCRGLLNVLAVAAKDERSIFHDLSMGINFCYYYLPPR